jgi:GNAT superfamily N-acetyltransferase
MTLEITPFRGEYVEGAARLLAARHARDREREPVLPTAFESPEAVRPRLERLLSRPGGAGVVALRGGEPTGFLLQAPLLPSPLQMLAQFYPPRSMTVPYDGHALAPDEDASLYRELYAALAGDWVTNGFFDHFVSVPASDVAAREAWDSLGFAREVTCATREIDTPVAGPAGGSAGLEIHQAGPEDIEVIDALGEALWQHHADTPIFAPFLRETLQDEREMTLELLADPGNAHFVAYRDGQPLAMNTFMTEGFLPPLLAPESCIYLFQGVAYPQARRAGVGKALLAHAMRWAHEQGHRWCALHVYAANISGASFWFGNGFRPLEHRLRRRVDERIAWAGAG